MVDWNYARAEMTFREVVQEMDAVGRLLRVGRCLPGSRGMRSRSGQTAEAERVILAASEVFHSSAPIARG